MRSVYLITTSVITLFVYSCGNKGSEAGKTKDFPKPGTVVATAQMQAKDELNEFKFSIKVVADSEVRSGVYDVDVDFGPNFAEGKFTMPKGGEELRPVLRPGHELNTYVIGFNMPNDTTFYDYYEVSCNKGATKMQYLKSYTF